MTEVTRYGLEKIVELTNQRQFAIKKNVYRETLRQLIAIFGNVYYQDGNGNLVRVKCTTGKQDRVTGKDFAENNLVLPYITIVEKGTSEPDGRRRNNNILVNEVIWDPKEKRAKRVISVAPKAVNIDYEINIWAKFNSDLDQIRYGILSLFNPALDIKTTYSDFTKSFVKEESDIIDQKSEDTSDRLVQKTISITVETYLPSPKFLFTNTGEIQSFNFDVNLQTGETEQTILRPPEYLPEGPETGSGGGGGGITGPLTLSGSLDDVQIVNVQLGQVLVWDGSYWTASSVAGVGGGVTDHGQLTGLFPDNDHPQYVLSSTNLNLSSNVSSHIASASVHFTSGSLSGAYVLTSTNSNLSSLVSNLQTSTASVSSVVNSHLASASVHFTSGSLSGAYVLTSTNFALSSLVNNHIGSAVHWELSTLNQNYINASGDSANAGFYLSSVSATNISATNYYNLPSATIVWEAARDIVLLVRNGYASRTILKGDPVTVISGTGNSGGIPIVQILSSVNTHVPDADLLSNHVAGLAREDIPAGAEGYIIIEGLLTGLNTDNFLVGDWLYVSSNGQLNNQRPTPPYESHPVGVVTRSQPNNGTVLVKIENSPELNDIVGFNLNSNILDGDLITYDLTTSTFVNKQTVTVSGLGKFGSVSATSVSSIHLSSIYVSANTIVTNKLAVGGSDGYIYNPDGDLYISATNGKVKFNTGFEVTGTISGTSISATTYLNLPSSTAIWNANQLQGRNVATSPPANGDALVWNGSQWEPSTVSTGGGSVTNNPGGSNGDIQFKNGASFSGVPSVNYNSATDRLNVTNLSAVNLTATNFTNAKLDDHIASASVHFTSGSLSGAYVLTSTNSNLSSLVNNLQVSTASISSVVSNHIASSDVHFTSGSLSGAYVLTSTNSSLSSLVNNLQTSTATVSSVLNSHIGSSTVHFTSGSLSSAYVLTSLNSSLSSLVNSHIASGDVHFASGSLSGAYVLTSTNSNLSSLVTNLQTSTATVSSILNSHIASSDVHFTSGSLSGAYVLTGTNLSLSTLVSNLQTSTASISSVVSNHIASSDVHFTSGSLSSAYVLTSTNSNLSSLVNNLQTSTATVSSVLNSHIGSSTVHFTSGSLSGAYVLTSTNSNLSSLVTNLQTSAQTISSTLASHIASSDVHFTSGSLSGAYVLTGTNLSLSTLVSNLQSSAASISSVVNAHLASAVHWQLSTLNQNYINASGDSASAGFYLSSVSAATVSAFSISSVHLSSNNISANVTVTNRLSVGGSDGYIYNDTGNLFISATNGTVRFNTGLSSTNISATNYINLPSGSQIWNADQIGSILIGGTALDPEAYHVIYYDLDTNTWETKSVKTLIDLGANFGLKDLIDVRASSVDPFSSVIFDGDPLVWDSNTSSWGSRNITNFAGNLAPELATYFVSAGGGTYLNSNYRVSSLSAATVSANTFLGGIFREVVSSIHSSSTQLVDVSPNCDSYLINTTTSAVTVRLPSASANTGRTILVTKVEADGSHRGVTVSGYITDNQTSAVTMYDPNESLRFISNGISWTNLDYQKSFGVVLVAKNNTASLIPKGTPLRLAGSDNNSPTIEPVSSVSGHVPDAMGDMPHCIGLAEHDFPPSSFGHVITRGLLYGVNTNSLITGDPVYISDNGELTNMMPMAPFESIHVGIVVLGGTTTDGIIYVDLIHPMYINEITGFDVPDTIDDTPSASHYKAIYYTSATRTFTADYIDHGFLIGLGDNDHPQYASSSVSATINTVSGNLDITTSNVNTVSTTLNSHIGSAVHWDLATLNSNYINASGDSSNNAFYFSSLSATTISATTYQNLPVSSLSGLADVLISSTPTTNYVLKWNGTKWAPASDNTGAGGGITDAFTIVTDGTNAYEAVGADTLTLSSSDSSITVTQNLGLFNLVVNESNVAHNSLSQLTTGDPHTQYALKSLSSTAYWNANKLQGINVSTTTPTSNQALVYNGTVSAWVPSSLPAGGGGGLTEGITAITDGIITYTLTGAETLQFESRDGSITWEVDYANNPTPVVAKISGDVQEGALTHNNLGGLTTGDPHTQYALKSLSSTAYWNANKLQGVNISSTAPTTNQALVYDGNGWIPSSLPAGGGGGVTFLSALSDVSAPTPTHKDILVYNSSVGRYVDTPIFPRSVAVHCDAGANITLTNQPNTEQFFANSNRNIFKANLTYFTQARICARVVTQSASVNNPRLYVDYATTFTTTVGSYLNIGVSPVSASLSSATYVVSDWVDLAAGAKADVFFTVLQNGGDGTADPALGPVSVEFR